MAKLTVLAQICQLLKDKRVNIYIKGKYGLGLGHDFKYYSISKLL